MGRAFGSQRAVKEIDLIVAMLRNVRRAWAAIPRRTQRYCVLCGHRVGVFLPYRGGARHAPPLMRALGMNGSDIDSFECPRCGAHDRERHLLLYMKSFGLMDRISGMRILHFAPERRLSQRIASLSPVHYVKCDLFPMAEPVLRVNIEAMPFDNASFDLVIANHVLEHVEDDLRAASEIRRVLRSSGMAILQTPYSAILHQTWCDPGIVNEFARRHAYGQEDHVRLYGHDIFERLAACGLIADVRSHHELLPDVDPREFGVNPNEPFFLFRR